MSSLTAASFASAAAVLFAPGLSEGAVTSKRSAAHTVASIIHENQHRRLGETFTLPAVLKNGPLEDILNGPAPSWASSCGAPGEVQETLFTDCKDNDCYKQRFPIDTVCGWYQEPSCKSEITSSGYPWEDTFDFVCDLGWAYSFSMVDVYLAALEFVPVEIQESFRQANTRELSMALVRKPDFFDSCDPEMQDELASCNLLCFWNDYSSIKDSWCSRYNAPGACRQAIQKDPLFHDSFDLMCTDEKLKSFSDIDQVWENECAEPGRFISNCKEFDLQSNCTEVPFWSLNSGICNDYQDQPVACNAMFRRQTGDLIWSINPLLQAYCLPLEQLTAGCPAWSSYASSLGCTTLDCDWMNYFQEDRTPEIRDVCKELSTGSCANDKNSFAIDWFLRTDFVCHPLDATSWYSECPEQAKVGVDCIGGVENCGEPVLEYTNFREICTELEENPTCLNEGDTYPTSSGMRNAVFACANAKTRLVEHCPLFGTFYNSGKASPTSEEANAICAEIFTGCGFDIEEDVLYGRYHAGSLQSFVEANCADYTAYHVTYDGPCQSFANEVAYCVGGGCPRGVAASIGTVGPWIQAICEEMNGEEGAACKADIAKFGAIATAHASCAIEGRYDLGDVLSQLISKCPNLAQHVISREERGITDILPRVDSEDPEAVLTPEQQALTSVLCAELASTSCFEVPVTNLILAQCPEFSGDLSDYGATPAPPFSASIWDGTGCNYYSDIISQCQEEGHDCSDSLKAEYALCQGFSENKGFNECAASIFPDQALFENLSSRCSWLSSNSCPSVDAFIDRKDICIGDNLNYRGWCMGSRDDAEMMETLDCTEFSQNSFDNVCAASLVTSNSEVLSTIFRIACGEEMDAFCATPAAADCLSTCSQCSSKADAPERKACEANCAIECSAYMGCSVEELDQLAVLVETMTAIENIFENEMCQPIIGFVNNCDPEELEQRGEQMDAEYCSGKLPLIELENLCNAVPLCPELDNIVSSAKYSKYFALLDAGLCAPLEQITTDCPAWTAITTAVPADKCADEYIDNETGKLVLSPKRFLTCLLNDKEKQQVCAEIYESQACSANAAVQQALSEEFLRCDDVPNMIDYVCPVLAGAHTKCMAENVKFFEDYVPIQDISDPRETELGCAEFEERECKAHCIFQCQWDAASATCGGVASDPSGEDCGVFTCAGDMLCQQAPECTWDGAKCANVELPSREEFSDLSEGFSDFFEEFSEPCSEFDGATKEAICAEFLDLNGQCRSFIEETDSYDITLRDAAEKTCFTSSPTMAPTTSPTFEPPTPWPTTPELVPTPWPEETYPPATVLEPSPWPEQTFPPLPVEPCASFLEYLNVCIDEAFKTEAQDYLACETFPGAIRKSLCAEYEDPECKEIAAADSYINYIFTINCVPSAAPTGQPSLAPTTYPTYPAVPDEPETEPEDPETEPPATVPPTEAPAEVEAPEGEVPTKTKKKKKAGKGGKKKKGKKGKKKKGGKKKSTKGKKKNKKSSSTMEGDASLLTGR